MLMPVYLIIILSSETSSLSVLHYLQLHLSYPLLFFQSSFEFLINFLAFCNGAFCFSLGLISLSLWHVVCECIAAEGVFWFINQDAVNECQKGNHISQKTVEAFSNCLPYRTKTRACKSWEEHNVLPKSLMRLQFICFLKLALIYVALIILHKAKVKLNSNN